MSRTFVSRSGETELMDADDVPYETLRDCLRDLAQVNVVTLGHGATIKFLDGLRLDGRLPLDRPVEIVDVGSGYGDLLRRIDRWGLQHQVALHLTGVDLSPWSAKAAAEATGPGRPIRWVTQDIFDYADTADVVVCSLFTHHLGDAQVVRYLQWVDRAASVGWHVNDLHRHPLPFYGFGLLARLMRWHRFVRHDGPVSIARAFTRADWRRLVAEAGLPTDEVDIRWRFPFRFCVSRVRPR